GGVAGLLGLLEGLEGFVVVAAIGQRSAQVEAGQRGLGLLEVLDRVGEVAEEERGDAELEVPALGRRAAGAFELLAKQLSGLAQPGVLVAALGQSLADFRDGAGVAVLALDEQRPQIDCLQCLYHGAPLRPESSENGRSRREACGPAPARRRLARL